MDFGHDSKTDIILLYIFGLQFISSQKMDLTKLLELKGNPKLKITTTDYV